MIRNSIYKEIEEETYTLKRLRNRWKETGKSRDEKPGKSKRVENTRKEKNARGKKTYKGKL